MFAVAFCSFSGFQSYPGDAAIYADASFITARLRPRMPIKHPTICPELSNHSMRSIALLKQPMTCSLSGCLLKMSSADVWRFRNGIVFRSLMVMNTSVSSMKVYFSEALNAPDATPHLPFVMRVNRGFCYGDITY